MSETRLDGNDVLEDTISSDFWFICVLIMGKEKKYGQKNVENIVETCYLSFSKTNKNLAPSS